MNITIRKTKPDDYSAVKELLLNTNLVSDEFTRKRFEKLLKNNGNYCLVAEAENSIVGNVFAMTDYSYYAYIYKLAIAKNFQRRGIASKLINTLASKLEELDLSVIFMHVERENEQMLQLASTLGFEIRHSHFLVDKGYVAR